MPDLEVSVPWSLRPGPEEEAASMEAPAQALDLYTHQPFEQKHKAPSPYPPVSLFNNNLPMAYSSASLRWGSTTEHMSVNSHLGLPSLMYQRVQWIFSGVCDWARRS